MCPRKLRTSLIIYEKFNLNITDMIKSLRIRQVWSPGEEEVCLTKKVFT